MMKSNLHRRRRRTLKLPHERDESTEAAGVKHRVIGQAGRDLAAGLVDTDNYTRASAITGVATRTRRRSR